MGLNLTACTSLSDAQYIHGWNINESVQNIVPFIDMIYIKMYYGCQTILNVSIYFVSHVVIFSIT